MTARNQQPQQSGAPAISPWSHPHRPSDLAGPQVPALIPVAKAGAARCQGQPRFGGQELTTVSGDGSETWEWVRLYRSRSELRPDQVCPLKLRIPQVRSSELRTDQHFLRSSSQGPAGVSNCDRVRQNTGAVRIDCLYRLGNPGGGLGTFVVFVGAVVGGGCKDGVQVEHVGTSLTVGLDG